MFSGAKLKLKSLRQKKDEGMQMSDSSRKSVLRLSSHASKQLLHLKQECLTVSKQLEEQASHLFQIKEDPTAVENKILILKENLKSIEQGLESAQACETFAEIVELMNELFKKEDAIMKDLRQQVSKLIKDNKSLRTQLQIFQDHHERSEIRFVELTVEIESLKFMSTLPAEYSFFGCRDEKLSEKEDEEEKPNFLQPKISLQFLEDDISIQNADLHISSVSEEIESMGNLRLKILFELIKSYIKNGAYDIALPLMKTTVEDYDHSEKIVFKIMEIMLVIYMLADRYEDAIRIQQDILAIRKEKMLGDKFGIAKALSNLAVLHGKVGKSKAGLEFCKEAYEMKKKLLGERHVEVAKEIHNLGVLSAMREKFRYAIGCVSKASDILLASHATNSCHLELVQMNLASLYWENGQLSEAKTVFRDLSRTLLEELGRILEGQIFQESSYCDYNKLVENISDVGTIEVVKRLVSLLNEITEKIKQIEEISDEHSSDILEENQAKDKEKI